MVTNLYTSRCTHSRLFFFILFLLMQGVPALLNAQSYRIMPLGNSITEGTDANLSYRYDLYESLKSAYIDFTYVGSRTSAASSDRLAPLNGCFNPPLEIPPLAHEGHWGWRADEIINGKSSDAAAGKLADWLQGYTPDVVLLHIGSNDIFQNHSVSGTVGEIREIIRSLRQDNPNVIILLAKLFPAHAPTVGATAVHNLKLLNDNLPALVQELHTTSSPIHLVDQYTGVDPAPGVDTYDGIHPNYAGAKRMAQRWASALKSVLRSYTTPPAVQLNTPQYGTVHLVGQATSITAEAWDREEAVKRVEFYANCKKIGEDFTSPYALSWTPSEAGTYTLHAKAVDAAGAIGESSTIALTVSEAQTGKITREYWANVAGTTVAGIPLTTTPSSITELTSFEAPSNVAGNYGQRVRGYITAPATGDYVFWIASDDNSELWLSTTDSPWNKRKIASVSSWTSARQWDKYASQKSAPVRLEASKRYYIEALHKEGSGGDNLAVGWQIPGGTLERPIPAHRLSPFGGVTTANQPPVANAGADVSITLPANSTTLRGTGTDRDGTISSYKWTKASGPAVTMSGAHTANLYVSSLLEGTYVFRLTVTDNGGLSSSDETRVVVNAASITCTASGTILREQWNSVSGSSVTAIPLHTSPGSTHQLSLFEAPIGVGSNYGARVRGYICPPLTGNYTFFIASDDNSELWLSTTDSPANKVKIASVTSWTNSRQWDKYASQKSAEVRLEAGKRYYIEALHKQGWGGDNLAVGWQLPNGTLERPIPGNRLSPYLPGQTATAQVVSGSGTEFLADNVLVSFFPNPFTSQIKLQLHGDKEDRFNIRLYDISGREVWHIAEVQADQTLVVGKELETGVYILVVKTGKTAQQYKLVKAR